MYRKTFFSFLTGNLHLKAILFLAVLAFLYFSPLLDAIREWQSDICQWINWKDSLPVFVGLSCSYIFFFFLTKNRQVSLLGAIAYAFSSVNVLLIRDGQVGLIWAIDFIPLILSGFLLASREKYLLGSIFFIGGIFGERSIGQIQLTYYLTVFFTILYVAYTFRCFWKKEIKRWLFFSLTSTVALTIAALPDIIDLDIFREMQQYHQTISLEYEQTNVSDAWSYEKDETFSLLIPNIRGGASSTTLDQNSRLFKEYKLNGKRIGLTIQAPTYWGKHPISLGAVYSGACICFFFVLGMFIIKNKIKWQFLAAIVFFIFLSWGENEPLIHSFLLEHFPMYVLYWNPPTALILTTAIIPIIAVWGLKTLFHHRNSVEQKQVRIKLLISLGLTAVICLFFYLFPEIFYDFKSPHDAALISDLPAWYYNALLDDRKRLLQSDALRSLIFVLLSGSCLLFSVNKGKKQLNYSLIILIALVLVDLWLVDKRY